MNIFEKEQLKGKLTKDEIVVLSNYMNNDTLQPSDIEALISKMKNMRKLKEKYQDKIKTRKDGRQFYVIINRKQITSSTLDGLYEKLYGWEYGKHNYTLEDLFPEFMIWKRDYTPSSPKTLREYTILWNNHLKENILVNKRICTLKRKDFSDYFRFLTKDRKYTKKQFNNIKSVLNGLMDYAMELEIISHNPILDINCKRFPFRPVNRKNDVITIDERNKILEHLESDMSIAALAIKFDFCLTLRIGELLALRWDDIEGDFIRIQRQYVISNKMNDDLTFTSKSYSNEGHIKGQTEQGFRNIFLIPKAKSILEELKRQNPNGEYIFMSNGRQLSNDSFNRKLKKVCKELGLPPYSSHKIRFSSASILFNDGMELAKLQELLGHTNSSMTLHYIRSVVPEEKVTKIMCDSLG